MTKNSSSTAYWNVASYCRSGRVKILDGTLLRTIRSDQQMTFLTHH